MVEAFSNEKGVRKISYAGDGRFMLDYEISGTLDHGFVFPFNTDAEVAVPFIAIELRKDGVARVKAPGFVGSARERSEEHTSELQSLMRNSYAVLCLKTQEHTASQIAE